MNQKTDLFETAQISSSAVIPVTDIDGLTLYLPNYLKPSQEQKKELSPNILNLLQKGYPLLIACHLALNTQDPDFSDIPKREHPLRLLSISGSPGTGKTQISFLTTLLGHPGISLDPYSDGGNLEHYQNYFDIQKRLIPTLATDINPILIANIVGKHIRQAKIATKADPNFPRRTQPKFSAREFLNNLTKICFSNPMAPVIILDTPGIVHARKIDIFDQIGHSADFCLDVLPKIGKEPMLCQSVFRPNQWFFSPCGDNNGNISESDLVYFADNLPLCNPFYIL